MVYPCEGGKHKVAKECDCLPGREGIMLPVRIRWYMQAQAQSSHDTLHDSWLMEDILRERNTRPYEHYDDHAEFVPNYVWPFKEPLKVQKSFLHGYTHVWSAIAYLLERRKLPTVTAITDLLSHPSNMKDYQYGFTDHKSYEVYKSLGGTIAISLNALISLCQEDTHVHMEPWEEMVEEAGEAHLCPIHGGNEYEKETWKKVCSILYD